MSSFLSRASDVSPPAEKLHHFCFSFLYFLDTKPHNHKMTNRNQRQEIKRLRCVALTFFHTDIIPAVSAADTPHPPHILIPWSFLLSHMSKTLKTCYPLARGRREQKVSHFLSGAAHPRSSAAKWSRRRWKIKVRWNQRDGNYREQPSRLDLQSTWSYSTSAHIQHSNGDFDLSEGLSTQVYKSHVVKHTCTFSSLHLKEMYSKDVPQVEAAAVESPECPFSSSSESWGLRSVNMCMYIYINPSFSPQSDVPYKHRHLLGFLIRCPNHLKWRLLKRYLCTLSCPILSVTTQSLWQ